MAASTDSQPLTNTEPSQPQESEQTQPQPMSYAEAVATEPNGEAAEKSNGAAKSNDQDGGSRSDANTAGPSDQTRAQLDNDKIIFQKHTGRNGTSGLTSVKPDDRHEESLKHGKPTTSQERAKKNRPAKRQDVPSSELASGRTAGAGWKRSAIRWAPLNVPLQRRLQTFAVLWHSITIPALLSFFFLLCAIPLSWPLLIPYLIYTYIFSEDATNGTLSRRSNRMRRSKFWSLFASYFPARLHRTAKLEPTRKYIFGYHPHGIISHGAFAAFATEALGFADLYPGITNTLLTLDANFRVPLYRDYALAMGLASVSRESIENILSKGGHNGEGMGRAVTIVIGGARESLDAQPHSLKLVLRSRKGFVKVAIRMGADLVPVLAFGENDLYEQVDSVQHPWIHNFQLVVKKAMGFTIPLFHARGIFNYDVGMMPYRKAVNVVVGKPINVTQQGQRDGNVDQEYLNQVHEQYMTELTRMWDEHKDTFAKTRKGELEIVE